MKKLFMILCGCFVVGILLSVSYSNIFLSIKGALIKKDYQALEQLVDKEFKKAKDKFGEGAYPSARHLNFAAIEVKDAKGFKIIQDAYLKRNVKYNSEDVIVYSNYVVSEEILDEFFSNIKLNNLEYNKLLVQGINDCSWEVVKYVLKKEFAIDNERLKFKPNSNSNENLSQGFKIPIKADINNNFMECMKLFEKRGVKFDEDLGIKLINVAVQYNNLEAIDFLLKKGANQTSAFSTAILKGNVELAKKLLDEKIDFNNKKLMDSVMRKLVETEDYDMMKELFSRGLKVNERIKHGSGKREISILYSAIQEFKYDAVKLLVEKGADVNNVWEFEDGKKLSAIDVLEQRKDSIGWYDFGHKKEYEEMKKLFLSKMKS